MKRRVYLGHEVEDEDGETVGDGEVLRVPLMLMDHILPSRRGTRYGAFVDPAGGSGPDAMTPQARFLLAETSFQRPQACGAAERPEHSPNGESSMTVTLVPGLMRTQLRW